MIDPDLNFGGLSLWVRGRTNPEASDYGDGNWLTVLATMKVGQSSVTTEGSILMTSDFERFRSELRRALKMRLARRAKPSIRNGENFCQNKALKLINTIS